MRKLSLLPVVYLLIPVYLLSQPCLPEGITFTTQSEIDNFQNNYPGCTEIQGDVQITGNNINNLNGLSVLTTFWGDLSIESDKALTSLAGFDNVMYIVGNLKIKKNDILTSLAGFDNLTFIGGSLNLEYNTSLASIESLYNVTYLGGNLHFEFNYVLESLAGLDNLVFIGGLVYFMYNPNLTSLTGLNNVISIGGDIEIWLNAGLTSLTGLDNIDAASIDALHIYKNFSLSTCEVKSICNYLASPNGTIEIHDNAPGCNSQAEVDTACATLSIENIDSGDDVTIFPNPAEKELFISVKNTVIINEVNIYNQLGQKVLNEKKLNDALDVSILRQGVYVVELVSDGFIIREKLIIR